MASNYYPMVSSSPPPLDDGPSFGDDEEEDDGFEFGNFASADVSVKEIVASTESAKDSPEKDMDSCSNANADILDDSSSPHFPSLQQSQPTSTNMRCCQPAEDGNLQITEQSGSVDCRGDSSGIPVEPLSGWEDGHQGSAGYVRESGRTETNSEGKILSEDIVTASIRANDEAAVADGEDERCPANEAMADNETEILGCEDFVSANMRADDEDVSGNPENFTDCERQIAGFEDAVSGSARGSDDGEEGIVGAVDAASETVAVGDVDADGDVPRLTDDACLGESRDVGVSGTNVEHIADLVCPVGGVTGPVDGGMSEVPEDAGDWAHSDSSFDDFTDFQTAPVSSFPAAEEPAWTERAESDDEFDNFATFDGCEAVSLNLEAEPTSFFDEDEFGTFNCATSNRISEFADANVQVAISTLLASAFPDSAAVDRSTVNVKHLDEALRNATVDDPRTLKSLWSHLHDIDNTHALTYHWSQSQSNKKLLHSLRIDARNFLAGTKWNSSMPLFAATLGSDPLEPKKATLPGDEENPKSLLACDISTLKFSGAETVVPPAQFDWGSSGLVNPLDGLESEFLGSSSASEGNSAAPDGLNAGPSLLVDKILSQAAKSSSATFFNAHNRRRASNLSEEATRVLDTLPDLSFMRAKVLMFPIRGAL